ncbi:hypothetical protein [Streptomyces indiaensis]|uniref:hypothetical protein n=1 Tax=Streptomyces indiaensis TaxID=284033 RepID=UPI001F2BBABC|nr:hypothetical protein [Streptomyces indiaensis]MCF1645384.1 hypothetical protein [Streptomyces indiaensis]
MQHVAHIEDFEDAAEGADAWPVIGWLLNARLALDPVSGKAHAFDPKRRPCRNSTRTSRHLIQVTLWFQRLLEEFTFNGTRRQSGR